MNCRQYIVIFRPTHIRVNEYYAVLQSKDYGLTTQTIDFDNNCRCVSIYWVAIRSLGMLTGAYRIWPHDDAPVITLPGPGFSWQCGPFSLYCASNSRSCAERL